VRPTGARLIRQACSNFFKPVFLDLVFSNEEMYVLLLCRENIALLGDAVGEMASEGTSVAHTRKLHIFCVKKQTIIV
jgi:hypothetical protein